jgi:hypothetical protein
MVGHLGALLVGLTVATTEFEEDIDGGQPPGGLPAGPAATTTEFEENVGGRMRNQVVSSLV